MRETVTYGVALADGSTGVVDACGHTGFLQLVAECAYEGLEVAVRAQGNDEGLGRGDRRGEREVCSQSA